MLDLNMDKPQAVEYVERRKLFTYEVFEKLIT